MTHAPTQIPGLLRWWCAADIAGAVGDPVVGWADRVVGQVVAPGGTANGRPSVNELNGIRSAYTTSTTGISLRASINLPDRFTVGFIWQRLGNATGRGPISTYNASSGTANRRFNTSVSTTALSTTAYRDAGTTTISDRLDYDTGMAHVVAFTTRPSEGAIELFINGSTDGAVMGDPGAPQTGSSTLSIFQSNQSSGNTTPGRFYDVVLFDHDLTPAELAIWHSYAQDRDLGIIVPDYLPEYTFTWWNGTAEAPLVLEGTWDGSTVRRTAVKKT